MKPSVSVAIVIKNVEKYIGNCIKSILNQTFNDFEIVVVDDFSRDNTQNIIEKFNEKRIRYFRNSKLLGLSKSRNKSLKYAKCEYIFFTDSDCIVSKNWIEEGLKYLKNQDCVGVEGKTYYVSEEYKPTFSDSVIENKKGGQFMTCNIAYKKCVLESIGGFDERFTYLEDRDLALRAIKHGKICFNSKMIVHHQKKSLNPYQFVQTGKRLSNRVLLYKKFGEKSFLIWRIADPLNLAAIIFPPLILGSFLRNRYKTKEDFRLFPFIYLRLIYERLNFWDMCARERIFLI
jgi:GT2 family glycosyltransferase